MRTVLVCPFGAANLILHLVRRLQERCPEAYEVVLLSFTEYGRALLSQQRSAATVHIPCDTSDAPFPEDRIDEIVEFSSALAQRRFGNPLREYLGAVARHYSREIDLVFERHGVQEVLLFNGRFNLFVAALDVATDCRGLPKLVLEQGIFRPDYLTIDGRGVNERSSIGSLDDLTSPHSFDWQQRPFYRDLTRGLPLRERVIPDSKRRVPLPMLAAAWLKMRVQPRRRLFLRTAEGRDLLEAGLPWLQRRRPTSHRLDAFLDSGRWDHVVLCPFQVETDTQIVLSSPWIRSMRQLVDVVLDAVDRQDEVHGTRTGVVFKAHPLGRSEVEIDHPKAVMINESTIQDIVSRCCDLVITVNSTAGVEAIEAGKPVLVLGRTFWALPGVVAGICRSVDDLAAAIPRALADPPPIDRAVQARFLEALRSRYQVRLFEGEP